MSVRKIERKTVKPFLPDKSVGKNKIHLFENGELTYQNGSRKRKVQT